MDGANLIPDTLIYVKMENQLADKIKSEKVEEEDFDNLQLTEEFDIKSEDDSMPDTSSNRGAKKRKLPKKPQTFGAKRKLFFCYKCNYPARSKNELCRRITGSECNTRTNSDLEDSKFARPMNVFVCTRCDDVFTSKMHLDEHIKNYIASIDSCNNKTIDKESFALDEKLNMCSHCNTSFKFKQTLDNHIVQKHPECIGSVKSRIHTCELCTFKTTFRHELNKHTVIHSNSAPSNICKHCNRTFKSQQSLDNHVVMNHPEFMTSINRKIHECSQCDFKTTFKQNLKKHSLVHLSTVPNAKISTCSHCNATFSDKQEFNNHIIANHPEIATSIKKKLHVCSFCSYKTSIKRAFKDHLLMHPGASARKSGKCEHCNVTFTREMTLDDHIVRNHPEFIGSVTRKIHECSDCGYKTTYKNHLDEHMLRHSRTDSGVCDKSILCSHCDASFKCKISLDDHILKKHPEFKATVTRKTYFCTLCDHSTVRKRDFDLHMVIHHGCKANSTK
ncbi:unnamed protein product [Acanthoscelides obtectus]|nr:unnamed protein product [Acanthoscelides obtectus]CAK1676229.1 Zinc finger protein 555 [Acanthoscelides obtectus]